MKRNNWGEDRFFHYRIFPRIWESCAGHKKQTKEKKKRDQEPLKKLEKKKLQLKLGKR
jgi:hypothetical protein